MGLKNRRARMVQLGVTLGLLALNLVALNYLVSGHSTARIDLTADRQFSISPVTKRILQSLDDDVIIHGFFSKRTHPKLAPLVPHLADVLEEYRAVSGGRVRLEILDPGTDEQAEEQASVRFGIQSTPFRLASKYESGIVNAYFAVVVQHGDQYEKYGFDDLINVEVLPDGDVDVTLRNLEYDLTRAIKKVVYGFRSAAELFERIDGPIKLTAIVSADKLPEVFKGVPDALRGAADELKERSDGKFEYQEIDPGEDQALQQQVLAQYGAQPMSVGLFGGDRFYLYGILQTGERAERLQLASGAITQASIREAIEATLRRQTPGFLKTVGIVSPTPEVSQEIAFQYQMRGMPPPQPRPEFQQVQQFLGQDYNVQPVSLDDATGVPASVDILLVLKPKNLSERAVFALDQYLMRGGRVILCAGAYETNVGGQGVQVTPVNSGLDPWLENIGVRLPSELVLDDQNQALPIPEVRRTALGMMRTWRMAPYPYLVAVKDKGLEGSIIGSRLEGVGIYWGSPVELDSAKTNDFKVTEVLRSSEKSWTSTDLSQVQFVEYQVPAEGTEPRVLAAALEGKFKSYFAGKQAPAVGAASPDAAAPPPPSDVVLEVSPDTRLLVVGNSEFVNDFVAQALGRSEGGFFTENLRFIENAIDWMALDSDMISIRSRASAARRLESLGRGAEVTLESINYMLPPLLLLGFGAYHFMRRRRIAPIVGVPAGAASASGARMKP